MLECIVTDTQFSNKYSARTLNIVAGWNKYYFDMFEYVLVLVKTSVVNTVKNFLI